MEIYRFDTYTKKTHVYIYIYLPGVPIRCVLFLGPGMPIRCVCFSFWVACWFSFWSQIFVVFSCLGVVSFWLCESPLLVCRHVFGPGQIKTSNGGPGI